MDGYVMIWLTKYACLNTGSRYFNEILQQTPESVEDVMVEADGQWHTSDNKYGSPEWLATHRPQTKPPSPVKKQPSSPNLNSMCSTQNLDGNGGFAPPVNGNGKARAMDPVYILDDSDDDDDEGQVVGALAYPSSASHSYDSRPPPETQTQPQSQSSNVIDLTLDSDDDDDDDDLPSVTSNTSGKRKATEYDDSSIADQLWKKGRIDTSRVLPIPRVPSSGSVNSSGSVHLSSSVNNHLPSPPPQPRFSSSFANNILPPPTVNYHRHGSSNPSSLQLPPLSGSNYQARQSQNTRWS